VRYQFSDKKSFWCPTIDFCRSRRYSDSSEVVVSNFLLTNTGEEWIHRFSMIKTKTRLHMAWAEALSTHAMLRVMGMLMDISERNKGFHLLVPLHLNLRKYKKSSSLGILIRDLERTCKIIYSLGEAYRPLIESFVLAYMKIMLDKMVADKYLPRNEALSIFQTLKQAKFRNDNRVRQFYPKIKQVIDYMQFDDWLTHFIHCLLSPTSLGNVPPLSLYSSFTEFNEKYVSNVRSRCFRFLHRIKKPILSVEDFLRFSEDNDLAYMKGDEMNSVFTAFETSCNFFSSQEYRDSFILVDTSLRSIKEKKTLLPDDYQNGDAFWNFIACCLSPLSVWEPSESRIKGFYFPSGLDKRTGWKLVHACGKTFLKYFLLDPKWECPFFGCFELCNSCIANELRKRKKLRIYSSDCPVFEYFPFGGINVEILE